MKNIKQTTLANGLRVVTDTISHVESVTMGMWVDVGTRDEDPAINGAAHMLEHMAFKGTTRRSAKQIAEEVEAVGGDINAYTSMETTAYHMRILKNDLPLAVDILGDILQNSTFDAQEFAKEQSVV
ncbi:MAG: pitrilysin family protein, partial [Alphaproteobacteria bacterium]